MRVAAIVTAFLIATSTGASARTWHITPDGTGDAPTIQAGIDSAATGDVVELAAGVFTGLGNRDLDPRGKVISIVSAGDDPAITIIDCEQAGRGFVISAGEGPETLIRGLGIRNGSTFQTWAGGGAVLCEGSSPTFEHCVFRENTADHYGGAFRCASGSNVVIRDCDFISNTARWSGGLACVDGSDIWISDSCFLNNSVTSGDGGMSCIGSDATIERCWFEGNSAVYGGGLRISHASFALVRDCVFVGNSAALGGGALNFFRAGPTIIGCTIVRNTAPGGSGAFCNQAAPHFENTLFAFNLVGEAFECFNPPFDPVLICCDLYGNEGGDWVDCIADQQGESGNFSADPLFCDLDNMPPDLTLDCLSPCAPGNHPDGENCDLIGALPVGCGVTSVEVTSWSTLKSLY